jgi:fused signal recognition particle receptor
MEIFLLILIPLVLLFGLGVLLVSRMRAGRAAPPRTRLGEAPPTAPPRAPTTRTAPPQEVVAPPGEPPIEELEGEIDLEELERQALAAAAVEEELDDAALVEVLERPRFRDRVAKARAALAGAFGGIRSRGQIDDDTWDDLEEALLRADVGVRTTDALLSDLRARVSAKEITDPDALLDALKGDMKGALAGMDRELQFVPGDPGSPNVWLFVGVNGVGKTTTIGKLGAQQIGEGRRVVMAAGDTFRAAAAEQLETWADRAGADLVRGNEGGDPSAVIFDAIQRASARQADLVLADTAGRLHTKSNLMDELRKVRRVADREPGRVTEVLLVIDATTGQNGLVQARQFAEATEVSGVVLTKLDGSAKGGIVFAVQTELGIPVKLVGLGEGLADLVPFDADEFVDALFEPAA